MNATPTGRTGENHRDAVHGQVYRRWNSVLCDCQTRYRGSWQTRAKTVKEDVLHLVSFSVKIYFWNFRSVRLSSCRTERIPGTKREMSYSQTRACNTDESGCIVSRDRLKLEGAEAKKRALRLFIVRVTLLIGLRTYTHGLVRHWQLVHRLSAPSTMLFHLQRLYEDSVEQTVRIWKDAVTFCPTFAACWDLRWKYKR